jgi:hypothetical protein
MNGALHNLALQVALRQLRAYRELVPQLDDQERALMAIAITELAMALLQERLRQSTKAGDVMIGRHPEAP